MSLLVNQTISAVFQLILFSTIPYLIWIIFARKKQTFLNWIGLKPIEKANRKVTFLFSLTTTLIFICLSVCIIYLLKNVELATSEFSGHGISGILPCIIYAFIKTGLSEEIVFRGFILKRLSSKLGFLLANIIQSVLFGLLHGVMLFSYISSGLTVAVILFTGTIGYTMGYINEKKANGSILSSWIIHGVSNVFASMISLFSII